MVIRVTQFLALRWYACLWNAPGRARPCLAAAAAGTQYHRNRV